MNQDEIVKSIRAIATASSYANRTMADADIIANALRELAKEIKQNKPYKKWSYDFRA